MDDELAEGDAADTAAGAPTLVLRSPSASSWETKVLEARRSQLLVGGKDLSLDEIRDILDGSW